MDNHSSKTDQQWVEAAQNGDFEAFRAIVLRYSNALLSVAYGILGDFHEAQDAAQESFVKAYRQLHTIKDPSQLGSWLHSIAHHTSLDFARKRKKLRTLTDTVTMNRESSTSWLDQQILKDSIGEALQTLEEKSRTAMVLHYLNDWTMKEVGQFLGLSEPAVESRIRRSRIKLKQFLSRDFEEYIQPHRVGEDFEKAVSEQVLKKMGHFYIPVTDKERASAWFIHHFHLRTSKQGHLLLEENDELYLLECQTHSPENIPILTFSVADVDELWSQLRSGGVLAESIDTDSMLGKHFAFYDPDKNKYLVVEKKNDGIHEDEPSIY